MMIGDKRTHTTLNISNKLIKEAMNLFKGKTKTEIIHEALGRLLLTEKLDAHLKKWGGKGSFKKS